MKCLIHRRTFIYHDVYKNVILYIGIIAIDFVGSVINRITPLSFTACSFTARNCNPR